MAAHALLRLCVVADDDSWHAVSSACGAIFHCARRELEDGGALLDEDGAWFENLVGSASSSDAVLVTWDLEQAQLMAALARRLRKSPTPLVALCSAMETDCVAALSVGADVVHPMPPSPTLLKAQIIAHRRGHAFTGGEDVYSIRHSVGLRARYAPARAHEPGARAHRRVEAGPLAVDLSSYTATLGSDPVDLTPLQLQVLALLVENAGSVLSRDDFLTRIWGFDFETGTNIVDVHMHYIRRALRDRGFDGAVKTIRGVGYRLDIESRPLAA
jgi:DNA-binding response OmpR family regulator